MNSMQGFLREMGARITGADIAFMVVAVSIAVVVVTAFRHDMNIKQSAFENGYTQVQMVGSTNYLWQKGVGTDE